MNIVTVNFDLHSRIIKKMIEYAAGYLIYDPTKFMVDYIQMEYNGQYDLNTNLISFENEKDMNWFLLSF